MGECRGHLLLEPPLVVGMQGSPVLIRATPCWGECKGHLLLEPPLVGVKQGSPVLISASPCWRGAGVVTVDVLLQKYTSLARELASSQAKITEKEEEIQELKFERTNMRVCGWGCGG